MAREGSRGEGIMRATQDIDRPLPLPDDATRGFWDACRRHVLAMQRCARCERMRFPPRPMCPACQSMESEWVPVSGRGWIYSFVIAHAPVLPAFQSRVPLPIVLVELVEDRSLRMAGNLVAGPAENLAIGAPVEVVFEDVSEDVSLPLWRIVADRARASELALPRPDR